MSQVSPDGADGSEVEPVWKLTRLETTGQVGDFIGPVSSDIEPWPVAVFFTPSAGLSPDRQETGRPEDGAPTRIGTVYVAGTLLPIGLMSGRASMELATESYPFSVKITVYAP